MSHHTRTTALRSRLRSRLSATAIAAAILGTPLAAAAQQVPVVRGGWRIEPAVGVWRQMEDHAQARRQTGRLFGLNVSRPRGEYARLSLSIGYHQLDEGFEYAIVGPLPTQQRTETYDWDLVSATAGAAYDFIPSGAMALDFGFEVGAGWHRSVLARTTEPLAPPEQARDWQPVFLWVPSLAVRRPLGGHVELAVTGRMLMGVGDISPDVIPTLSIGAAYRF